MVELSDTTALVLAAGSSRRWGNDDKLLHPVGGRPMASHVASAVTALPFGGRVAVVSRPDVGALFRDFFIIDNREPGRGIGHSLELGLAAVSTGYVLVCLADMPFVTSEHLMRLCAGAGEWPVASAAAGVASPPALFPKVLLASHVGAGDVGARELLAGASWVATNPNLLRDIDSAGDLTASMQTEAAH
jgi:molybdenum cofactor cytidylyltransferase